MKRSVLIAVLCCAIIPTVVSAQPFGTGIFNADVPYGTETSIAISLSGTANMVLSSSGSNFSGTGTQTVTVTSTDVAGYKLYVNASTSTSLSNGTDTIAASSNTTPGPLSVNTWGYNTTGSTSQFVGMKLSQVLLKEADGPYKDGDDTTITYGSVVNISKSSGAYSTDITYTAVGES